MAAPWEMLAVAGTVFIFLYNYYKKSYAWAYFVGIVFGLLWEISTEPLFNYSGQAFGFFIWKDIPLAVILAWGIAIAGFKIISDGIHRKYKLKMNSRASVLSDALVIGFFGIIMEYLGSQNFALWSYPATELLLVAGMPIVWPIGWVVIGLANLSLARRLENLRK